MPISSSLSPAPNLIFNRMKESFDKSFSFDFSSLPTIDFNLIGVVYNDLGTPVAGTVVSVFINGNHYLNVTTLPDGTFKFKLPISWEETLTVEMQSSYGNSILYFNFYDILVIAWVYASQFINVLQHLGQSKQDSYSEPRVGDSIQSLFETGISVYETLERTLKRRFANWPFDLLVSGTPKYKNFASLKYYHHYSTFHAGLKAIKDVIGADFIYVIPYDEYRLFLNTELEIHNETGIIVETSYQRIARRIRYLPSVTQALVAPGFYYVIAPLPLGSSYTFLSAENLHNVIYVTCIGDNLYKTHENALTYAIPSYMIYRPRNLNGITAPWGDTLDNAYIDPTIPDQIQLRVARYWDGYVYDVEIINTILFLGAVTLDNSIPANINIYNYHNQVSFQRVESLQLSGDGEIYFYKTNGWDTKAIKRLGSIIEENGLASRQFYTLFNSRATPPLWSLEYMTSNYWGGLLAGFVNFRRLP